MRAASWVGWSSECARVRMRKSAVLSLSVTVVPASSLVLQAGGNASRDSRHSLQLQRPEVGDVVLERGLGRDALGLALGAHRPVVDAAGEARQARALGAVAARQFDLAGALQVADGAQPVAREPLLRHLADAENQRHRLRRQEGRGLGAAEHRKAARLVEVGGDLGEELVAGEPDRDGDAESRLDLGGETAPAPWPASCRAAARCRTGP